MTRTKNTYDRFASQYAEMIGHQLPTLYSELIVPKLLEYVGEVNGKLVLDAGCGEGHISRLLSELGAIVIGMDVAGSLIEIARSRSTGREIEYRCIDLSGDIPSRFQSMFDLVVSNLVIDDVPDYKGYIRNLGSMTKPNARVVLTKNNPYSAVIRGKVDNYFDSGNAVIYQGMASAGVEVFYYHRTLEEYITEFRQQGFVLERLSDLKPGENLKHHEIPAERDRFERYFRFPFLMAMEFSRTG